jgi:hypothetical protein
MQYLLKQKNIVRMFFKGFSDAIPSQQKNIVRIFLGFSDAIPSEAEEYCAHFFEDFLMQYLLKQKNNLRMFF